MGDGLLVVFASVVDAVECAVAIQRAMAGREAAVPDDRRIQYRIGINLGDIVIEGEDILGDGVNVAARLEAIADPGGVHLSRTAYDQLKQTVDVGYEYLGEQRVKNIRKPVRVYRVLLDPADAGKVIGEDRVSATRSQIKTWAAAALLLVVVGALWWAKPWAPEFEPASKERMAYALPDKPSIAVLPFDNYSDDPKLKFFAKGLTEDLTAELAKVSGLFVIARNSAATYKGKPVDVKQVAEELGVQYVLEGSVQKAGERLRITAQLIDALSGNHLWSDRFDRQASDVFALQDEIVKRVFVELQVKLTVGDHARVASRGTTNLNAWLLREQGMAELYKFTRESTIRTRELMQRAHEADPSWSRPVGGLAFTYWFEARRGWTNDREEWIRKGMELAKRAIEMDPKDTLGYMQLGNLYQLKGDHARAIDLRKKAVEIAPNDFQANWGLGSVLSRAGQAERAVEVLKHAERLSPRHPVSFTWSLSNAQVFAGHYKDAVETAKRAKARAPNRTTPRIHLAAAYIELGRIEEARDEAKEVLRIDPKFTVSRWKRRITDYKDRAAVDRIGNLLLRAGLPAEPAIPLPDKPSIAVLPFDSYTDDPTLKFFAEGLTEDLTAALAKVSGLFVIARNSAATYKGKPVKVKQVARELGIQYVLEGSVQKTDGRLRITVQLIDAISGNHLWAERYDRQLKDLFELQDDVVNKVLVELQVKLTEGDNARIASRKTANLDAWLLRVQAVAEGFKFSREGFVRARELYQAAREADPNWSRPLAGIAWTHEWDARRGWSKSKEESVRTGMELARKAIDLDPMDPLGYQILGNLYFVRGEYSEAIALKEKALELAPNAFTAMVGLASLLYRGGEEQRALVLFARAKRVSPIPIWWLLSGEGTALHMAGQNERAVKILKEAIGLKPKRAALHVRLAAVLASLGQFDEAREEIEATLVLSPKLTISRVYYLSEFQDPKTANWYSDLLRKAGLPE